MAFFKNIFRRSKSDEEQIYDFVSAITGKDIYVSEENSLALSAVWACVRILSNTVAILPLHLYRKTDTGRQKVTAHPAVSLLQHPNDYWTTYDMLQFLMVSVTLWGNGYARIRRDRNYRIQSLQYLMPYDVTPQLSADGLLFYRINTTQEVVYQDEILHVKGMGTSPIEGKSPIRVHRENMELSKSVQTYGSRFFTNGGNTSGLFTHPGRLNDKAWERLKSDLNKRYMGLENSHNPMLLEDGLKYERINIPLEDAQFLGTRKFQKTEIATIFGVPPHMIADLERATNNNIEHQGMEFVVYSLLPYLARFEQEFKKKLLQESEKDLYFRFAVNGLMRGDSKTRSEFYKNMTLIGAMSANEVREMEEMNTYPGGERYYVQLNMQDAQNPQNSNDNEKNQ